jgi:hypothetical protein
MADYRNQRQRSNRSRQPQGPGIEQQVVEGIFKGIWWLISLPFVLRKRNKTRAGKPLLSSQTAQQYANYWNDLVIKAETPATRDLAIAEADKLMDVALRDLGLPGQTMGERLKAGEGLFSQQLYSQLWDAHKLRNRLAHEVGVQVSEAEAKMALAAFQWGLRTLGVFV